MTTHTQTYFTEMLQIISQIDGAQVEKLADELVALRERGGRLFLAGLGGSAANCSHAANDFAKLCGIPTICLTDNVAQLTAWANDSGWQYCLQGQMETADAGQDDALMVFSVGGGTKHVSTPLVQAMEFAGSMGMERFAIVGKDGGQAALSCVPCIVIPVVQYARVTPHTEAFQMVLLHCLVSNPALQMVKTKW